MSILAAMQCGPISDHSFFLMSPHFQVSDSRQGPGAACMASSWAILLITPAQLCAQESSWPLVCVVGSHGARLHRWEVGLPGRVTWLLRSLTPPAVLGLAQCLGLNR